MSANTNKPERTALTNHLIAEGWTPRLAKQFIDRHWTLLGTATYDEWDELGESYFEANA